MDDDIRIPQLVESSIVSAQSGDDVTTFAAPLPEEVFEGDRVVLLCFNRSGSGFPFMKPPGWSVAVNGGSNIADTGLAAFFLDLEDAQAVQSFFPSVTVSLDTPIGSGDVLTVAFRVINSDLGVAPVSTPVDRRPPPVGGFDRTVPSVLIPTPKWLAIGLASFSTGAINAPVSRGASTSDQWSAFDIDVTTYEGNDNQNMQRFFAWASMPEEGPAPTLAWVTTSSGLGAVSAQIAFAGGAPPPLDLSGSLLGKSDGYTVGHMIEVGEGLRELLDEVVVAQDMACRRPRLYALVCAWLQAAKLTEQVLRDVYFGMTYEGATGREREAWGKILGGIPRGSFDERTYRLAQDLRILADNIRSSVPGAIELLQTAFPDREIEARPNFPKGAHLRVSGGDRATPALRSYLTSLLRDFVPPGDFWYVTDEPADPITFGVTFAENETRSWVNLISGGR